MRIAPWMAFFAGLNLALIPGIIAIVVMMRQEKAMTGPNALPIPENSDPQVPDVPPVPEGFEGNEPTVHPIGDASEDVTA